MQNIINIEGRSVAVGLQWRVLRGTSSEKKEIAEIAKEEKSKAGFIFAGPTGINAMVGIFNGQVEKNLICGAAWLAQTIGKTSDIILVDFYDDNYVWVCAVKNGAPLQGFDAIIEKSQVYVFLGKLLEPDNGAQHTYTIYSPGGFINDSVDGDLISLTSYSSSESKIPFVTQITGVPRSVSISTAIGVTLLVAYCGYNYYSNQKLQEDQMAASAAQAATDAARVKEIQLKAEQIRQGKLNAAITQKLWSRPEYEGTISTWLDSVGSSPASLAGWSLTGVVCKEKNCTVEYTRNAVGTTNDFIAAANKAGYKVGKASNKKSTLLFPIKFAERRNLNKELPAEGVFVPDFLSQLQKMELAGVNFEMRDSSQIDIKSDPVPGKQQTSLKSTWKIGAFNLSGNNFFEARDSEQYLRFSNIAAETLNIDFLSHHWTIGGIYATN